MSERKTLSNRQNAQRSTGPRTLAGKQKASQNARRHGLSKSVLLDPEMSAEVARLASHFAGETADEARVATAYQIAEARVDLNRIAAAKRPLIEALLGKLPAESAITVTGEAGEEKGDAVESAAMIDSQSEDELGGADLQKIIHQLEGLERYSRRAFSTYLRSVHQISS